MSEENQGRISNQAPEQADSKYKETLLLYNEKNGAVEAVSELKQQDNQYKVTTTQPLTANKPAFYDLRNSTRDILRIDKTSARKLYCGVKCSKTMHCGLKRWQSRFRKPKSALPTFLPPNGFLRLAFRFRFEESVEAFAKL